MGKKKKKNLEGRTLQLLPWVNTERMILFSVRLPIVLKSAFKLSIQALFLAHLLLS